jgi:hypothetical protein
MCRFCHAELLSVGNSSWALYYLSSHPYLWKHLCERELPIGAVEAKEDHLRVPSAPAAAASPSTQAQSPIAKQDWKNEYLARLHMKQSRAAPVSDEQLRLWSS